MDIGIILSLIGVILAVFGLVPLFFEVDKYYRKLAIKWTKQPLLIEEARVTFDVKSISKVFVYYTGRYKILKPDPVLLIPFKNIYGNTDNFSFSINNRPITPEIIKVDEDARAKYKVTDLDVGESFILDSTCLFTADQEKIDRKNDALGFWFDNYRCRYLRLSIIFPTNFYPNNVRFTEGATRFGNPREMKESFGSMKLPALFGPKRRMVEWLIEYPKFQKGYKIYWSWDP